MDTWEATKIVFERVRKLDPENARKIVGMLLIEDSAEKEMIRLAFGPDDVLHSFVARARAELGGGVKPSSAPSVLGPLQQTGCPWGGMLPSPAGEQMGCDDGRHEASYPEEHDCWSAATGGHRRTSSLSDVEAAAVAGARKPCRYFKRGFCRNGPSCRFLHASPEDDADAAEREVAVMQRAVPLAARQPPLVEPAFVPFLPPPEGLNFMLPQSELQRSATMLLGAEDMGRFSVRSPLIHRDDFIDIPAERQIYLTFPADSTFTENDVSHYFSSYGPVQDVRIPYQPKRMFGFVTFLYPETVRLILGKGNPHLIRDASVLVKPYKEKGKVPNRLRKLQRPQHHGEFLPGCMTTPTGLFDPRVPFHLQQPLIGPPGMMLGDIATQEAAFLRRRKLIEQRHAAELQQAFELQIGMQLLELKNMGHHHLGSPVGSPMLMAQTDGNGSVTGNGNAVPLEDVTTIKGNNKVNSSSIAMGAAAIPATAAQGNHEERQKDEDGDGTPKQAVNPGEEEKRESGPAVAAVPNVACGFQESVMDHNLPESLFSSPVKATASTDDDTDATSQNSDICPHHVASSLFFPTTTSSSLELPPYNSCFFQVPRFTSSGSGHEAVGL